MRIITTAIIKGGTGKTTTAAALAQAAAAAGKRVLAIDLDPQGNLTFALAADANAPGSYELIEGKAPAGQLIQRSPQGLDVISARADLAQIHSRTGSAKRLAEAIKPLKRKYDFMIIDTPPTMGELQTNALIAATDLIIPLEADINSLQGLYTIAEIARQLQNTNAALNIAGVIITRYDSRPKLARFLLDTIRDKAAAGDIPFLGAIRAGIAVKEAAAMQQSLFEYAPKSKPAIDYLELYRKITEGAAK